MTNRGEDCPTLDTNLPIGNIGYGCREQCVRLSRWTSHADPGRTSCSHGTKCHAAPGVATGIHLKGIQ